MTDLLVTAEIGALPALVDLPAQLVTVEAAQWRAGHDIQPAVVSVEAGNIVRVAVDDWPERVPVTYEGELVTFEGETVWTRGGSGMADLEQLGEVLQRLTNPYERRVATQANKRMPCRAAEHDYDLASEIAVQRQPAPGAYVGADINGVMCTVGDGTRDNCELYLSADGGLTARAQGSVQLGDTVHFNPSVAGYVLTVGDVLNLHYEEGV